MSDDISILVYRKGAHLQLWVEVKMDTLGTAVLGDAEK